MSRVIAAFAQFFDGTGDPLENGWLEFLASGTTSTQKPTYSDSSQTIPNANPLQLDAEGRCPNAYGQGVYKVRLYENNPVTKLPGALIQEFDPVWADQFPLGASGNFAEWVGTTTYNVGNIVTYVGNYYTSLAAANTGNVPSSSSPWWEQVSFIHHWNTNATYELDDVIVYNSALYFSLADANQGNIPLTSPTWWNPVGSGTILLNWSEVGTAFVPDVTGYNLGLVTKMLGNIYMQDNGNLYMGNDQDFYITFTSGEARLMSTTSLLKLGTSDANAIHFLTDNVIRWDIDSSGNLLPSVTETYNIGSAALKVNEIHCKTILADEGLLEYWEEDVSGNFIPIAANTYNIGGTGQEVANFYANSIYAGLNQEISITHNGVNATVATAVGRLYITTNDNNDIYFETNAINRWSVDSTGIFRPITAAAYDIGSAAFEVRSLYLANDGFYLGTSQQLRIWLNLTGDDRLNISVNNADLWVGTTTIDDLHLGTAGQTRWTIQASTGELVPSGGGNYDIGTTSDEIRNIYMSGDLYFSTAQLGRIDYSGADLRISNSNATSSSILFMKSLGAGSVNIWRFDPDGHLRPETDSTFNIGDPSYKIANIYADAIAASSINFADNEHLFFGTDDDLDIYHSGSNAIFVNDTGNLSFVVNTVAGGGGDIRFSTDNALRWYILSTGHLVPNGSDTYNIGSTANEIANIYVGSTGRIYLGTTQQMSVFHNSTNGIVSVGSGYLRLETTSANPINFNTDSTLRWVIQSGGDFIPNSSDVYDIGDTTHEVRSIYLGDAGKIYFGLDQDMSINHTGAIGQLLNSTGYFQIGTSGATELRFLTNSTNRWAIQSGGDLIPLTAATYNIGTATYTVNNIYAKGNIYVSASQYLSVYHTNSFISGGGIVSTSGPLVLNSTDTSAWGGINILSATGVSFKLAGSNRWVMTSAGTLRPGVTNSYNIGESSLRVANFYGGAFIGGIVTVSADSDAVDVSNKSIIKVDTSGGNVVIGGLANGIEGQIVHVIKTSTSNTFTLEHNEATGTQKIFTSDATDKAFSTYEGTTLIFNGTNWFEANN